MLQMVQGQGWTTEVWHKEGIVLRGWKAKSKGEGRQKERLVTDQMSASRNRLWDGLDGSLCWSSPYRKQSQIKLV